MSEMVIDEQVKTKEVTDYDFTLLSGARLPLTLDSEAGDRVNENSDHYFISLVAKPNYINPDVTQPAEDIKVLKSSVAVLITRTRQQVLPTPEQLFNMQKTLFSIGKSVQ